MNIDEKMIRNTCKQCIEKKKAFEFIIWCIENFPPGWQPKLRKIFQEELKKLDKEKKMTTFRRTKYAVTPFRYSADDIDLLRREAQELEPKIFTKSGTKRKRINPENEKRWNELAAISEEWSNYIHAKHQRKREIEHNKQIRRIQKALEEAGFKEGDDVSLVGRYYYPVMGRLQLSRRDGIMMVDRVVLSIEDIKYLQHT